MDGHQMPKMVSTDASQVFIKDDWRGNGEEFGVESWTIPAQSSHPLLTIKTNTRYWIILLTKAQVMFTNKALIDEVFHGPCIHQDCIWNQSSHKLELDGKSNQLPTEKSRLIWNVEIGTETVYRRLHLYTHTSHRTQPHWENENQDHVQFIWQWWRGGCKVWCIGERKRRMWWWRNGGNRSLRSWTGVIHKCFR